VGKNNEGVQPESNKTMYTSFVIKNYTSSDREIIATSASLLMYEIRTVCWL